ncbi:hypothetical protein CAPTEDRAFT_187400 [Capitella teleta]|uniref:VWFD domain-containing protein n=1 Tax=Capitella teleta TaxID=283909 RepID=R7TSS8_CAPTE|nr:hypothetical protein CAPTEDRAFT_187400 [Capitella teleta]|eukprot:ELT96662.1 hypothetical protein CAPTEDRAFT_187400 [Capitella teleta]
MPSPKYCQSTLVTDECGENGDWNVSAIFDHVEGKAFVKEVSVVFFNRVRRRTARIRLEQGLKVKFGSKYVQSFPKQIGDNYLAIVPALFAHPKDFSEGVTEVMSITLPNGVNIQYDGVSAVKINMDGFSGSVCGLCGNHDGVYDSKDLRKGYNVDGKVCNALPVPAPSLAVTNNKEHFVNSWIQKRVLNRGCVNECIAFLLWHGHKRIQK